MCRWYDNDANGALTIAAFTRKRRLPAASTSNLTLAPDSSGTMCRWYDNDANGDLTIAAFTRKRRRRFTSKAEAAYSYMGKVPFRYFRGDVLRLYVEHGFRPCSGKLTLGPAKANTTARLGDAGDMSCSGEKHTAVGCRIMDLLNAARPFAFILLAAEHD